ncbi:MAG: AraC family transcriptional regulator [Verrucomicrobiae bacterium]|nr:AraC family transcriptional regulator [Verrucomicrobiae bacterium]
MNTNKPALLTGQRRWIPGEIHLLIVRVPNQTTTLLHEHDFHEIVYIESGSAEHLTAGGIQKLHPGDIIILQPRMWHQNRQQRGFSIINCLFDNSILRQCGPLLSRLSGVFDMVRRCAGKPRLTAPLVLHAQPSHRAQIVQKLEGMMTEMREKKRDWQAVIALQLLDYLVFLSRLSRQNPGKSTPFLANRAMEAVVEAADYIEEHFTENLGLDTLAKRLHLSPAYLSRSFARQMGMGIIRYLHHVRIEEACRVLRYSDESISRTAGLVGYQEIAYFSRCFRHETGMSPRQYRSTYRHREMKTQQKEKADYPG